MKYKNIFKRYESKYLISQKEFALLRAEMDKYMIPDEHGKSTICNIYLDTPTFLLIRRSIEKPVYKEKLRIRSYGVADKDTIAFLELKKKFKSIVYKRRLDMTVSEIMDYIYSDNRFNSSQILREINYCFDQYENLQPRVFLSYDRSAFFDRCNSDFRITFDKNILWRDYDLSLCKGIYGDSLLDNNMLLMEIKSNGGIPLWMTQFLNKHRIFKTSFSKYGNAYKSILLNSLNSSNTYIGGIHYA